MKLKLLCDIYIQMYCFIYTYSLIYYNKYFDPQMLPFTFIQTQGK